MEQGNHEKSCLHSKKSDHYTPIANNVKTFFTDQPSTPNKINIVKQEYESMYKNNNYIEKDVQIKNTTVNNYCSMSISNHNALPDVNKYNNTTAEENNAISGHYHNGKQNVLPYSSSSDENKSSGHASMSDNGIQADIKNVDISQKNMRSRNSNQCNRARYRATPAKVKFIFV